MNHQSATNVVGYVPRTELCVQECISQASQPCVTGKIDRFEIVRELGSGGMGIVLLARDPLRNAIVAIKTIRPEFALNPRATHRFAVEAAHVRRIRHRHVLEVYEVVERSGGPYFVMPYIESGSLANRLRLGEPLDEAFILNIAQQVADALRHAHDDVGLIHRDIKPENVLVDSNDNAFLADFGLVRTVFNDTLPEGTQLSWTVGTRPYMAPEIVDGKAGDPRADIYSFGAMLYELATGRPPYAGDTGEEIFEKIRAGPPVDAREINPKLTASLAIIIQGAMGRELRDRYAHMADLLADIQRIRTGLNPVGPYNPMRNVMNKSVLRRFRSTALLVAAASVAICGTVATSTSLRAPTAVAGSTSSTQPTTMPRFDASFAAAIDSGSAMRVREFVLSNPASVNLKLSTGDWPLSYAIRTGREEAAIALIQNGADLTLLDPSSGDSFLHIAATHGRLMVIEALVQNGASPSQPHNLTGRTPMDYAAGAPDRATVELLRRLQSRSQRRN